MRKVNIVKALASWEREYGGGRTAWLGYPKCNILHPKHRLGTPAQATGKTLGDECQSAYMKMLHGGYEPQARALEVKVFCSHLPFEDRQVILSLSNVICPSAYVLNQWAKVGLLVMADTLNYGHLPEYEFLAERTG